MNINKIMQQAQKMQAKMEEAQESLASTEYEGAAGGGMVKITINGKMSILSIKIDPSIIDPEDAEMLEDLITAAFNDAKKKAEDDAASSMSNMTGQLGLPPGFKMPF